MSADAYPTLTRPRSILADESVDLTLRAPRMVDGAVTVPAETGANGRFIPATLEFTPTDLAGVWTRHYPAIRKELCRKYPRHSWPDDGRTATPPEPRRR